MHLTMRVLFAFVVINCISKPVLANKPNLHAIINDLPASWAINIAPDNRLFVTHRAGAISTYNLQGERLQKYSLTLPDLFYKSQGGLLAVAFAPDYMKSPWVYLSYTFGNEDKNGLKVIRIMFDNKGGIAKLEQVFKQRDLRDTPVHYGGRLGFLANGSLLVSIGDGFDYRELAQVDSSQIGKILLIAKNKSVQTFSKGHRNPQGLLVRKNGQVISHEHGPDGGDEINIIEQGSNYGWPVITFGQDYIGGQISPFTEYIGMLQPNFGWTPSIAPSGMIFYQHERFPEFQNSLLVTSLKFKQLHRIEWQGSGADLQGKEQIYFPNSGYRLRDITQSADGRIFILSDGENAKVFEIKAE